MEVKFIFCFVEIYIYNFLVILFILCVEFLKICGLFVGLRFVFNDFENLDYFLIFVF